MGLQLEKALELFKDFLLGERGYSNHTAEAYLSDLKPSTETATQNIPEFIEEKIEIFTRSKLGRSSVRRKLSSLRTFIQFLNDEFQMETPIPNHFVSQPLLSKREALTESEMKSILETVDATRTNIRDRAIVYVIYATGLRVSELLDLERPDFDAHSGTLTVRSGKGGKNRVVPVAKPAEAALEDLLETLEFRSENEKIFRNARGLPLTRQSLWRILKMLALKSGVDLNRMSPHILRHTFATQCLEAGLGLRSLQILLGHAKISTTEIYTKMRPKHLKSIHKKYHPRGG